MHTLPWDSGGPMAKGNSPNYQYERWISEQRTNYQTLVTYPILSPPIALCCYSKVFIFKGFLNFIVLLDFIDFLVYFTYAYEAILWSVFCWGCNSMLRNMFLNLNSLLVPFLFWVLCNAAMFLPQRIFDMIWDFLFSKCQKFPYRFLIP